MERTLRRRRGIHPDVHRGSHQDRSTRTGREFLFKASVFVEKAEWESVRQRGVRGRRARRKQKTQLHETDREQREGNPLRIKPPESIRQEVYFVVFGREQPYETQMDEIK